MLIKEGNREHNAVSSSRLKASSVGALTISIGYLLHEMRSLTEKAIFLRSKRKLRWRDLESCPRRFRSAEASKNSACGKFMWYWNILLAKMSSLRSRRRSREKIFSRQSRSSYGNSLIPLIILVTKYCMRSIRLMFSRR